MDAVLLGLFLVILALGAVSAVAHVLGTIWRAFERIAWDDRPDDIRVSITISAAAGPDTRSTAGRSRSGVALTG